MPLAPDSGSGSNVPFDGGGSGFKPPPQPSAGGGASGFQQALAMFTAQYGPQQQQYQNQYNQQMYTRPGELAAGYQNSSSALQNQYNAQLAGLGLSRQGNAIDQADVARQMGYYNQMFGVDQGQYNTNVAYQNALKGYLNDSYGVTTSQHDNALGSLADQASQTRWQAGVDTRNAASQSAAAGAFTSQGHQQDNADINSKEQYGLSANARATKQENLGYIQSTIDRDRNSAGIDNTISSLTSDFERTKLTHSEQESRLQSRQQQLGLQAQQYGVSADMYAAQLQQGLASLNLNQIVSVGQLMDAASSTSGNISQIGQQIIQMALQYGPYLQGSGGGGGGYGGGYGGAGSGGYASVGLPMSNGG